MQRNAAIARVPASLTMAIASKSCCAKAPLRLAGPLITSSRATWSADLRPLPIRPNTAIPASWRSSSTMKATFTRRISARARRASPRKWPPSIPITPGERSSIPKNETAFHSEIWTERGTRMIDIFASIIPLIIVASGIAIFSGSFWKPRSCFRARGNRFLVRKESASRFPLERYRTAGRRAVEKLTKNIHAKSFRAGGIGAERVSAGSQHQVRAACGA